MDEYGTFSLGLLTVKEVSRYLRCSPSTVRKLMNREVNPLKSTRISERKRFVKESDLFEFIGNR